MPKKGELLRHVSTRSRQGRVAIECLSQNSVGTDCLSNTRTRMQDKMFDKLRETSSRKFSKTACRSRDVATPRCVRCSLIGTSTPHTPASAIPPRKTVLAYTPPRPQFHLKGTIIKTHTPASAIPPQRHDHQNTHPRVRNSRERH